MIVCVCVLIGAPTRLDFTGAAKSGCEALIEPIPLHPLHAKEQFNACFL